MENKDLIVSMTFNCHFQPKLSYTSMNDTMKEFLAFLASDENRSIRYYFFI